MRITSRIYGCKSSNKPDMLMEFDISEEMKDGKWFYGISNIKHQLLNEPISELSVETILTETKSVISEIIKNPLVGNKWIRNPDLHIFYDDETKGLFIKEKELLKTI